MESIHLAYQVVPQKLHDKGGVLVALLTQSVELYGYCQQVVQTGLTIHSKRTGNSIIERLLGKVARLIWRVENLVVEHREVKRKTKTDRVGWGKVGLSNFGSSLVCLQRLVCGSLALVTYGELGQVAVVVTLPKDAFHQHG